MDKLSTVMAVEQAVKQRSLGEGSGHDWWHIDRVRNMALHLASEEKADAYVTELAALLHDVDDWKFSENPAELPEVKHIMAEALVPEKLQERIATIIHETSFKGAGVQTPISSIESACVQDADRLDAIGAIGVARAFAFGGAKQRPLFEPEIAPENHDDFAAYQQNGGHTINHFYEKLLLLKDRMQTKTGKLMAFERHAFMEVYLERFMAEWNGDA